jgi:hypothetical protein
MSPLYNALSYYLIAKNLEAIISSHLISGVAAYSILRTSVSSSASPVPSFFSGSGVRISLSLGALSYYNLDAFFPFFILLNS